MSAVIGIMGGICSGKSTVARMLSEYDFTLVDADAIAHEMLGDKRIQNKLREAFGDEIIQNDGTINNSHLAELAFSNSRTTQKLNAIMHPPVIKEIDERIARADSPVLLDAALLVEKGLHEHYCDVLLFVDAPESQRLARARSERNWDGDQVVRREKLQVPLNRKKELADIIVSNCGSKEQLAQKIPQIRDQIQDKISE